jgi:hypothetical protein
MVIQQFQDHAPGSQSAQDVGGFHIAVGIAILVQELQSAQEMNDGQAFHPRVLHAARLKERFAIHVLHRGHDASRARSNVNVKMTDKIGVDKAVSQRELCGQGSQLFRCPVRVKPRDLGCLDLPASQRVGDLENDGRSPLTNAAEERIPGFQQTSRFFLGHVERGKLRALR